MPGQDHKVVGTVMYDRRADLVMLRIERPGIVPPDVLQALPGLTPGHDPVSMVWTCYPELPVLALAERYGLDISGLAREAIQGRADRIAASCATETDVPVALGDILRPCQVAGAAYMLRQHRVLNADEMGIGKTSETIAAIETDELFPALVVCPAGLCGDWLAEIHDRTPHRSARVWDGRGEPPDTDYVIMSFGAAARAIQEG